MPPLYYCIMLTDSWPQYSTSPRDPNLPSNEVSISSLSACDDLLAGHTRRCPVVGHVQDKHSLDISQSQHVRKINWTGNREKRDTQHCVLNIHNAKYDTLSLYWSIQKQHIMVVWNLTKVCIDLQLYNRNLSTSFQRARERRNSFHCSPSS